MQAIRENPRARRIMLLSLVIVVLLCLVGALVYNILTGDTGGEIVTETTPTPEVAVTEEVTEDEQAVSQATPTPTRVIQEETPAEATEEPAVETTTEPADTPAPTPTPGSTAPSSAGTTTIVTTVVATYEVGPPENVLENGGFEQGFQENGVAIGWEPFKSDNILVVYSGEGVGPYTRSGSQAQRITTYQASQGDQYTGIYQQIEVAPNEPYELTLHGQIRTGFGDVNQSSFGYRMQYAIAGGAIRNWRVIPAESWVELPWDEQLLNSPGAEFMEYTTEIVPTTDQITLFIRTWNKWADPGEAHFTLDDLSLVGASLQPVMVEVEVEQPVSQAGSAGEAVGGGSGVSATPTGGNQLVDNGLPTTGAEDGAGFSGDSRFWGALVVLALLALGAIYRARWSH